MMHLQAIISKLFMDYSLLNPSVEKIHTLLKKSNEDIINDHIAFRTYNLPNINIDALAKAFEVRGYKERGNYRFKEKKLTAKHFENDENLSAPKIFISQLETKNLSIKNQKIINTHYQTILQDLPEDDELIFHKTPWFKPSYKIYQQLKNETEYGAWMYVYGFRANHFTILVNQLKSFDSLENLNKFLIHEGFELNQAGGVVKGTKKEFLKQSSTLADKVEIEFTEGKQIIPACYYEFAERFHLPNNTLFNGFITQSANKIFESTNYRK